VAITGEVQLPFADWVDPFHPVEPPPEPVQLVAPEEDQVMDGLPLPTKEEGEALTLQETRPGFVTVNVMWLELVDAESVNTSHSSQPPSQVVSNVPVALQSPNASVTYWG